MEKPSTSKTLRRLASGSPSNSFSKGGSRPLGKPKGSLGWKDDTQKQLQLEDSHRIEKMYNRSTQLVTTPSCRKPSKQIKAKGLQELLTRSEANVSIFKGKASVMSRLEKKKPKEKETSFAQGMHSVPKTPKLKGFSSGILNRKQSLEFGDSARKATGMTKKAEKETIIDINSYLSQVPVTPGDPPVYEQFKEFLLLNSSPLQVLKEGREKAVVENEENMPTTRPISVEDNKQSGFKHIAEKKKLTASTSAYNGSAKRFSARNPTSFGSNPTIKFDIPKKLTITPYVKESKLQLKAVEGSSSQKKPKVSRMTSQDTSALRKEVSPSIQKRVSVIKESPLIPLSSKTKQSVFFAQNLDKNRSLAKKKPVHESSLL